MQNYFLKPKDFSHLHFWENWGKILTIKKNHNFGTDQAIDIKLVSLKSNQKHLCKYIVSQSTIDFENHFGLPTFFMFFTNSYVFLVIVFSFCVCVEFFCCIRCIHYQTLCVCVCARVCVRVWIYLVFTNFYLSMFTDDGFLMTVLVVTCVVCFVWLFCPGVVMLLCLCVC